MFLPSCCCCEQQNKVYIIKVSNLHRRHRLFASLRAFDPFISLKTYNSINTVYVFTGLCLVEYLTDRINIYASKININIVCEALFVYRCRVAARNVLYKEGI